MAAKYSIVRHNEVEFSYWLVFGIDGSMRFSRGEPSLVSGERAMKMRTIIPQSVWRTPLLRGEIVVSGDGRQDVTVKLDAAASHLKEVLGIDIDMRIEEQE